MFEAKAKMIRDTTEDNVSKLEEELEVNRSVLSRLLLEKTQNDADTQVIKMRQMHPLQRDPTPDERKSMHMIKQRAAQIHADLTRAFDVEQRLTHKKQNQNEHIVKHGRMEEIKELRKHIDLLKSDLATDDNNLSDLPVVVGRNIGNVADGLLSNTSK
mmetsp:Transcript_26464/g.35269  ORF Transcript_26464/g.35269 Transcript_26464/m.35269 type:complete len:158 (+) Transcript_26464:1101-1574(+)